MNDAPNTPAIWARQGEVVTCINGHPICHIARDILVGEPRDGSHFTDWLQPEPDRSESVADISCRECRGVWVRGNIRDGYQFHFGNNPREGWR